MTNNAKSKQSKPTGKFEQVLTAWQDGQDVAWAELMTAWVQAPAAPRSPETIARLIKHLDGKLG